MSAELLTPDEALAIRQQIERLKALRRLKQREAGEDREEAARYLHDPAGWIARYMLRDPRRGLTDYQREIVTELVRRRRAAVRGPHGLGKTMLASATVLWFSITREQAGIDWKILTTASAWRHLSVYLWPEIKKWSRHIDWEGLNREPFNERTELLDLNLKLGMGAASAIASNIPEKIEGAHADSLLYVLDEAKIIPDGTWDAVEGAFSGGQSTGFPEAYALAISTPGPPRGRFYDIHRRRPGLEDWWTRHVKVEEAVAAGRISPEWVEQRRRQWGANSARFANRVLGEFHEDDTDALIPLSWVEAAIDRWLEWDRAGRPALDGRRVTAVDVARSGSDSTIIGHRVGACLMRFEPFELQDTMTTVARVQPFLAPRGRGVADEPEEGDPKSVGVVDTVGVGAGVYDRLRELRLAVSAYTGSARSSMMDRSGEYGFTNTRSAAYWNLRELLDPAYESALMLPDDDEMVTDLTAPTFAYTSGVPPKIQVEPKDKVHEKLGRSPDRGDNVAMAFFYEQLRRDAQITQIQGQTLPTKQMSPLGRSSGGGGRSGMGPLG